MAAAGTPRWPSGEPGGPDPLGVRWDGAGVGVAVWAPLAESVDFCLVDDDGAESRITLPEVTDGTHHGYVPGVSPGARYGLRAHGRWDPGAGLRFNAAKLLLDPYARAVDGDCVLKDAMFGHVHATGDDTRRDDRDSVHFAPKSVVVADDYDWGDDTAPGVPWGDTVVYECHVKGMTAAHPGIPENQRGTYAGMAHPAVLDHLVSLGVTTVELLPVHHFVSEEHLQRRGLVNYWGYNSIGYFAPHGGYSSAGTRGQQVDEFRSMVRAMHGAGLEVVLDVVYNHTAEGNQVGPMLSMRGLDNGAYYKLAGDRRFYLDYTGCGNSVDGWHPATLRLVMDSLRYWVAEMHVDGFRFDLAPTLARAPHDVDMRAPLMQAIAQDPLLRSVKLIAEPWDVGAGGYQVGGYPSPWSEWNDKYRATLRDFWRGAEVGVGDLGWRLSGSADVFGGSGRRPYASVNFVTAHDGFTLRDLVSYDSKHNEANGEGNRDGTDDNRSWNHGVEGETSDPDINLLRHRQIRNLLTTLLLAAGVPMLVAGDEMGRTQRGNNNAYCQDNRISWLDWDLADWQRSLLDFTRRLLRIRREHAVFRQRRFFEGTPVFPGGPKDLGWIDLDGTEFTDDDWHSPDTHVIGMYLSGWRRGRTDSGQVVDDDSFLLLLNAGEEPTRFVLPGLPWGRAYVPVVDTTAADGRAGRGRKNAGSRLLLAGRSAMLLRVEEPAVPA